MKRRQPVRKLRLIAAGLAGLAIAMFVLQLAITLDMQGNACLLCIWERLRETLRNSILLITNLDAVLAAIAAMLALAAERMLGPLGGGVGRWLRDVGEMLGGDVDLTTIDPDVREMLESMDLYPVR